jgi:methyl-accepting chemotaxis protein
MATNDKKGSLSIKVVVLVTGLTLATFCGLFLANYYWQRSGTMTQIKTSAQRSSALLQMAISEPMTIGDNEGTSKQFRSVSERFPDISAYLTNYSGEVTYATEAAALRRPLPQVVEGEIEGMLRSGLEGVEEQGGVLEIGGAPYYAEVISVPNEPACHHCHGASRPVLGSMVMLQDISEEMGVLNKTLLRNGFISLAGLVILVVLLLVFMRRAVIDRIKVLTGGTNVVRSGDLDVAFEVGGSDEITSLAENLTSMVGDLKQKMGEASDEAEKARKAMEEAEESRRRADKLADYQKAEVENLSGTLQKVSEGDLTVKYVTGEADQDTADARESFLGIQEALNATIGHLAGMLTGIKQHAETLAAAAEELSTVSSQLFDGSENLSNQAGNVAGATEQISTNINTMAAATEEMSVNVSTVSSTAEEMSQTMDQVANSIEDMRRSISAIADSASAGSRVASDAMDLARNATDTMNSLGGAAQEIGKVTEVIKRIAEQTNLLALNATIEAASAGEAGKGFAVVAHEIKELANQSAKAAEDIADKIEGMQNGTNDAVKVIGEVAGIITTINDSVQEITESVEQQNEAANVISVNVSETNKGSNEIAVAIAELAQGANDTSQNAGEVAKGANEVASSILGVSKAAENSKDGSQQVKASAEELAKVAGELTNMVGRFVAGEDAAN